MDCRELVGSRTKLTADQVDDLFQYFDTIKDNPDAKQLLDQRLTAIREKADEAKALNRLQKAADTRFDEQFAPNAPTGYDKKIAFLRGEAKNFTDARNSVANLQEAWRSHRMTQIGRDLIKATGSRKILGYIGGGIRGILNPEKRAFNVEVARALAGEGTEDTLAQQVADVFRKHGDELLAKAQALGSPIKKLQGYIAAQTHDAWKVSRADKILKTAEDARQAWKAYIMPRLDPRTFSPDGTPANPDEFLNRVYDNITKGRSGIEQLDPEDTLALTPAGLARSLAKHRVLHFKDAKSFVEYNEKFGRHVGIGESLLNQYGHLEEKLALLDRMGPNPEGFFKRKILAGERKNFMLNAYWSHISHMADEPENLRLAHIMGGVRAWMNLSSLGGSMISSFPDIGNAGLALRAVGVPYAKAYANIITNLFSHIGKGIANEHDSKLAEYFGIGLDAMMHRAATRWDTSVAGLSARLNNLMFHVNGQAWWDDVMRFGAAKVVARHLAEQADTKWNDLGEDLRHALAGVGINGNDWRAMRSGVQDLDGKSYMLTDGLSDDLANKYRLLLQDVTRSSVPLPGAAERGLLLFGTKAGTPLGEALRAFAQFKYFPTAMLSRVAPKAYHLGWGHLLLGYMLPLTVLGYLSGAVKSITRGEYPNDPWDGKTWVDAFTKGGAASYLGDLFFHDFSYGHGSFADYAIGPSGATVNDLFQLFGIAKSKAVGQGTDTANAEALKLLFRHLPFSNLPYAKAAVETAMMDPLLNAIDPGYVQRERMREQEQYHIHHFVK